MTFLTDEDAIAELKEHLAVKQCFLDMREDSKELKSLVNGTGFIDELINKIEGLESEKKAKARKKYSKDVQGFFRRLFQPIDNIYYATGGLKDYSSVKKSFQSEFISKIANISDNKPLSEWIQTYAIQLFNTDPNGLIFLEYTTKDDFDIYPTYKSINNIRYYKSKGQLLDYLIFEPKTKDNKQYWRIVDDKFDRTFERDGETFTLIEKDSFEHPFGNVPAIICSNISIAGEEKKLSAISNIISDAKEYARDQSFLTLYKIYKGNPIFWRYVSFCRSCSGTGKQSDKACTDCDGHGKYVSKGDVTDVVELPIPTDKETPNIAPDIAGFISPDLNVWEQYNKELEKQEKLMYKTHWGTNYGMDGVQGMKTATEVTFDKQPLENQLNKYADFAEFIEWKLSEWIVNAYDLSKDRKESVITVNLGRRYIIDSYDVLLERYEKSVEAGENNTILDKLFLEYLGAKYRNNPVDLQSNLLKARIEPYLHTPLMTVNTIFGQEEAQRKVLFQKWWNEQAIMKDEKTMMSEFNAWFELNKKITKTI